MSGRKYFRRESLSIESRGADHRRIQIRPDVVLGNLQRALQRSLDIAAIGLQRSRDKLADIPEIAIFPGVHLGSRLDAEALRQHYQPWVMGHAITDVVEALEPFLADMAKIHRTAGLPSQQPLEVSEVQRALQAEDLEILPLGKKLDVIARECPGLIPPELREALRSLNKLRVCLTHSAGRVRKQDCNTQGALELSRVFWEFWIEYKGGRSERVVQGMMTEEVGSLVMRRSRVPRRFKIGESVQLREQDLAIIASTVLELSLSVRKNLYTYLRQIGRFPSDFREPGLRLNIELVIGNPGEASIEEGQSEKEG